MDYLTWLLTRYPLMSPDGGDGDGGGGGGGETKLPKDAAELQALLDGKAADTRRAIERDQKTAIDTAVQAALDKAKTDAEAETQRQKDLAAGNFDEVRKGIEKERDDAKTEAANAKADADARQARIDRAEKLLKGRLDDRVKALDHADLAEVKKDYLARFPDDTAPLLDRLDYLDDPRTVAAIAKVESQTNAHRDALSRTGGTVPVAQGNLTDAQRVEQAKQQNAQTGAYAIA